VLNKLNKEHLTALIKGLKKITYYPLMNEWYGVPLKVQPFLSKGKNTAPQWTFKMNRAPATAET